MLFILVIIILFFEEMLTFKEGWKDKDLKKYLICCYFLKVGYLRGNLSIYIKLLFCT